VPHGRRGRISLLQLRGRDARDITARAGTILPGGRPAPVADRPVAALAKGVMATMFSRKRKILAAAVIALAVVAGLVFAWLFNKKPTPPPKDDSVEVTVAASN